QRVADLFGCWLFGLTFFFWLIDQSRSSGLLSSPMPGAMPAPEPGFKRRASTPAKSRISQRLPARANTWRPRKNVMIVPAQAAVIRTVSVCDIRRIPADDFRQGDAEARFLVVDQDHFPARHDTIVDHDIDRFPDLSVQGNDRTSSQLHEVRDWHFRGAEHDAHGNRNTHDHVQI